MSRFEHTELERRLANLAQLGVISEVDLSNPPRAKVQIGEDFKTGWLRMGMRRAGDATESWGYSVGEEVLVISTCGDFTQGVIICALANTVNSNPAEPGTYKLTFPAGAEIEVNNGVVFIDAPGGMVLDGDLEVKGGLEVAGDVEADGDVKAGDISLSDHTHSGVLPGGASTGGPS